MLDEIFEGRFSKALQAAGANIVNHHASAIVHHPASGVQPWLHHQTAGTEPVHVAMCTRHLFETTVRQLVSDNPKISISTGASVAGLVFEGDAGGGGDGTAGAAAAADDVGGDGKAVTGGCLRGGGHVLWESKADDERMHAVAASWGSCNAGALQQTLLNSLLRSCKVVQRPAAHSAHLGCHCVFLSTLKTSTTCRCASV